MLLKDQEFTHQVVGNHYHDLANQLGPFYLNQGDLAPNRNYFGEKPIETIIEDE